jgi:hypothetical protein
VTAIFLLRRRQHGHALSVDEGSPVAPVPTASTARTAPSLAESSRVLPLGGLQRPEGSKRVGAGTTLNEDAIAGIIANLVREENAGQTPPVC